MPKISIPRNNKKGRVYVCYTIEGIRYREYNGNRLGLKIYPNRCTYEKDKTRHLKILREHFQNALQSGWTPVDDKVVIPSLREALTRILDDKLNSGLSANYLKNLKGVHNMFVDFLDLNELNRVYDKLKLERVEAFLNLFRSSERNYINRRRCLGTFFSEIVRREWGKSNLILRTRTARAKAVLHIPYSEKQLKELLAFLKTASPNLYLCCLITYGCLLRPHREVLRLKRKHIADDYSYILLSGRENKSGRNRKVFIPDYVQEEWKNRLNRVTDSETNLFTLRSAPFSEGYFNLMWQRLNPAMKEKGLLHESQTIYSFRHTAAIRVYQTTKDPHVLQQLLQHSSMAVTLNYLRGLGEVTDERLKVFLPKL